ncbi:lactoylglutathione lyase [Thalassotalea maritima]|uniref:lactoylglutathione lyase n=1 Tax=Thalassotalea maritima TaxID=3242416 RepID=UPI0035283E95
MNQILHTMLRVNNLEQSIAFYRDALGMQVISRFDNSEYQYTLVFMGYESQSVTIELTYNWDQSSYEHGTAFGHIAIGSDDIYGAIDRVRQAGGTVTREPGPVLGGDTVIAFAKDPNGYAIEFIQTAGKQ